MCSGDGDTEAARCGVGCDRGEGMSVNERAREKERDEREPSRSKRRFGTPEVARAAEVWRIEGEMGRRKSLSGGRSGKVGSGNDADVVNS